MSSLQKLYKGSYNYFNKGKPYSEENFEILEDYNDFSIIYKSEILSRAPSGEFYKINTRYHINKKYEPIQVTIKKSLGEKYVTETFNVQSDSSVEYIYKSKVEEKKLLVPTYGHFHISTPDICTSLLYIKSKKFNTTGVNFYSLLVSDNDWYFKQGVAIKNIYLRREGHVNGDSVRIKDKVLTATKYFAYLRDQVEGKNDQAGRLEEELLDLKPVVFYLSKHITIPYLVEFPSGIKIEIKFLNDLRPDDAAVFRP